MFAHQVVGLAAQVHEELEAAGRPLATVDDVGHVGGQHEGSSVPEAGQETEVQSGREQPHLAAAGPSLPFKAAEHLRVAQELPKVDVEHVTRGAQHDVVVVAIADAQDVGGHAAARARVDEVL